MRGKQSKSSPKKPESIPLEEEIPVNTDVEVTGLEEDIPGMVVQGHCVETIKGIGVRKVLVRFPIRTVTDKGKRFLRLKKCLTLHAVSSCLYILDKEEIHVRHPYGNEREISQSPKQEARRQRKKAARDRKRRNKEKLATA